MMHTKAYYVNNLIAFLIFIPGNSGLMAQNKSGNSLFEVPLETIHMVTDRDIYVSGDYLLFQAWQQTSLPTDSASGIFYLTLSTSGLTIDSWIIPFENTIADGNIYLPDTLSTGEYYLTAYTNLMRNFSSESFFIKPLFIANRFDNTLQTLSDENDSLFAADRAVFKEHLNIGKAGIETNFPFEIALPDTAGKREMISLVLQKNEEEIKLNHLHVRVVAEETLAPKLTEVKGLLKSADSQMLNSKNRIFPIEHNAKMISGHIEPPFPEGTIAWIVSSTPDTVVSMLCTSATATGSFSMAIPFSWQNREVYMHFYPFSLAQNHRLILDENTIAITQINVNFNHSFERNRVRFLQNIARARIAWRINQIDTVLKGNILATRLPVLFSKPNQSIKLSDYIPFDDLQDISREIIPQMRLRRDEQKQFEAFMIDESSGIFLQDGAAVFVDGIMSYSLEPLMHLNSQLLSRIDLRTTRWVYGQMEFHGILSLHTQNNEYLKIVSNAAYTPVKFEFYHKDRDLITMEKVQELSAEIPDLRHVLYWGTPNEIIKGEQTISLVTGDLPGKYIITLTGLNQNGELVSWSDYFVVK